MSRLEHPHVEAVMKAWDKHKRSNMCYRGWAGAKCHRCNGFMVSLRALRKAIREGR